ncbi:MAG: SLC13 family permease [Sphingobium sp.]|uniref:SLC13 family permease n=1 Tax=Sphingobium sp. TaxID=1912891 RepID=UPI0029BE10C7|nr:SLC13 family permease [Sphingobium sp.]MDX3911125.1 SLC13 family permease [Sphingobium sp.]
MTAEQILTLLVLAGVVGALIWDQVRADVVALAGAALLLITGAVRPSEVQSAFGSPAIVTLASLFVIAHALELSGLLDRLIGKAVALCRRIGSAGIWMLIGLCGGASAFLNNTPIVVLAAPVVRDVANSLKLDPRRFLIPLSYAAVLGGCCTLIGTSTNLLVDDMARSSGQAPFSIFEITPVGVLVALAGGMYLLFAARWLGRGSDAAHSEPPRMIEQHVTHLEIAGDTIGDLSDFGEDRRLRPVQAITSSLVFFGVVLLAALDVAPIAATAFAGAVLLILLRVISPEQAYGGLRPEILLLIAGMVVIGIALEQTGLASAATDRLVGSMGGTGPLAALIFFYGATMVLTELLSNATVAVLVTPVAVALAESLGVSPRPFLVAIMIAGSAAFATPFGYQTNVLVFQMGKYRYTDFIKIGLPLNLVTWVVAVAAITWFFPF